jgi:DNA-binding NarL/FixJ family response regulator
MDGESLIRDKITELRGKPQSAEVKIEDVVRMLKSMLARLEEYQRINPPKRYGPRNPHPFSLDPEVRKAILEELKEGHLQREIAQKWGVSQAMVSKINVQERR